jgi:hypothetical protein
MTSSATQLEGIDAANEPGTRQSQQPMPRDPTKAVTPETPGAAVSASRPNAASTAPSHNSASARKRRWLSPAAIFGLAVAAALYAGFLLPTERYITPKRGIGYALGIVGGSMMLLLFLYSARKRFRGLRFLGPTVGWFRYHMVLGVLGPLCILYHANFGLGAANSNVALFSMLAVAGSGLVGRYIYARIHHGLYGSKLTLEDLQKGAEGLRTSSGAFTFLPELVSRLDRCERRILDAGPKLPVLGIAKLAVVAAISLHSRAQLRGYIRRALRVAGRKSKTIAAQRSRLRRAARSYVDTRLAATRRVAGFQAYERLFSLWHALHLPLIFLLITAGVVHVVAVNIY